MAKQQTHLQRWNAIKSEKAKYNPSYPFLFPRPYEGLYEPVREVLRSQADNVNCQVRYKSCYTLVAHKLKVGP